MSKYEEKTISTKHIHKGRIIDISEDTVELPNKKVVKREIVKHPGAVTIIALTEDKKIIFVRQFRKPIEEEILEIPAGLVHWGEKESPKEAAARELEEEAGYKAGKIEEVFAAYASPGYSSELIRYFLATELTKTKQRTDDDELMDVELIPLKDCWDLIEKGKIKDNKTIIGVVIAEKLCSNT